MKRNLLRHVAWLPLNSTAPSESRRSTRAPGTASCAAASRTRLPTPTHATDVKARDETWRRMNDAINKLGK
jgi:hypothetical protein